MRPSRTWIALLVLGFAFTGVPTTEAMDLFRLVVDPTGPTPFSDATGRHDLLAGGVDDIDPGAPVVAGSVVATGVLSPDGNNAALLTGGWLEVLTSSPSFANDFLFAADQNLTVSFWFKSAGNGLYDPPEPDRMHALGFGSLTNNLDLALGDPNEIGGLPETACWTYFGGQGSNAVIDGDPTHSRNYYLDDAWHRYAMVREAGAVTVYLDGNALGTTLYADLLGSADPDAHQYIGRASVFTAALFNVFPWFGYIADVRISDQALPPPAACGPVPAGGCRLGLPGRSSLQIIDAENDSKDQLKWKWNRGSATAGTDFKDPASGSPALRLCIYDGAVSSSQPLLQAAVLAGGTCGAKPCWKTLGSPTDVKGYAFANKSASPDGVVAVKLKAGIDGKAQVQVKAKGSSVPLPTLPLTSPITVQLLVGDGDGTNCWQSTFTTSSRNDAQQFKAKGP